MSEIFSEVLNYHAPLKQKSVRGNHAPFMTRELSKNIMAKSKVTNSYVEWPSRENFVVYKKAKKKKIKNKNVIHYLENPKGSFSKKQLKVG